MNWFKNLSIFWKVLGSIAGIVLLIVLFQAWYFPSKQINSLGGALDKKARSLAMVMSQQLASALDFGDKTNAGEGLSALANDEDFSFAVLFDGQGGVLAASGLGEREALKLERPLGATTTKARTIGETIEVWHPILTKGGTGGMLAIGLKTRSLIEESVSIRLTAFLVGLVILAISVLVAFWVARRIGGPLQDMAAVAEKVAAGDLGHPPVRAESNDEVGRLADSFNRMLESQRNLVKQIATTAEQLSLGASELIASAQQQEQGAREQSMTVEEVSTSMSALAESARAIAANADRLAKVAEDASSHAATGQQALQAAGESIEQIVSKNDAIAGRINALYERSQAIISVVDIIDDISDRLDLLALNAALEGSRVGEAGKGFSLVAQEMRRLAENVSGSTKQIKGTIEEIHRYIQSSLDASREGTATSREGAAEIDKMAGAIAKIFSLIAASSESADSITVSTQQQMTSSEQMVAAMSQVANVSNEGLDAAQSVTHAAADMTELATRLRDHVQRFTIDGTSVVQTPVRSAADSARRPRSEPAAHVDAGTSQI